MLLTIGKTYLIDSLTFASCSKLGPEISIVQPRAGSQPSSRINCLAAPSGPIYSTLNEAHLPRTNRLSIEVTPLAVTV
jgi:hypothetical protein